MISSRFSKLRVGDVFTARVSEILDSLDLIMSVEGELLRVANQSKNSFKKGDEIDLLVVTVRPLKLRVLSDSVSDRGFHVMA